MSDQPLTLPIFEEFQRRLFADLDTFIEEALKKLEAGAGQT